jgi:hypothetical protein
MPNLRDPHMVLASLREVYNFSDADIAVGLGVEADQVEELLDGGELSEDVKITLDDFRIDISILVERLGYAPDQILSWFKERCQSETMDARTSMRQPSGKSRLELVRTIPMTVLRDVTNEDLERLIRA